MSINILIADDKREICDSIEDNLKIEFLKFGGLDLNDIHFKKAFTDHAFKHGCKLIEQGFAPEICIFDLVFNGDTGVDLYRYAQNYLPGKKINLCIYTGTEKTYEKRRDAEIMASSAQGLVQIIPKPNISEVLEWVGRVLTKEFGYEKKYEETDPFDVL
jgi:hypothetical protein